ncbi:hypothetical protein TWF751_002236 [Orbilia oligospora]|nr:hypothetical protein TWF751_002236 [Orbilia oligospora]
MNAGANPSLRIDARDPITASTTPSSERKLSIPTPPSTKLSKTAATTTPKPTKIVLDAAAAKKTTEEALSTAILQGLPNIFDDISDPITPQSSKKMESFFFLFLFLFTGSPVTPMFAQGNSNSTLSPTSGNNSAAISPSTATVTTTKTVSVPTSIFPGFDMGPVLRDPGFGAQLGGDGGTAEVCYACLHTLNNSCFLLLCRMGIVILVVGMEEMERRRSRMD